MSILNRFKSKKEQEVAQKAPTAVSVSDVQPEIGEKASGKKATKEQSKKEKKGKIVRSLTTRVILSPLITEKAARLGTLQTYVFEVARFATRVEVAKAFKDLYGVQPTRVNIVNLRAEPVRFGRIQGKRAAWKKAMVTVPKGKEIQVYEGI